MQVLHSHLFLFFFTFVVKLRNENTAHTGTIKRKQLFSLYYGVCGVIPMSCIHQWATTWPLCGPCAMRRRCYSLLTVTVSSWINLPNLTQKKNHCGMLKKHPWHWRALLIRGFICDLCHPRIKEKTTEKPLFIIKMKPTFFALSNK